MRGHRLTLGVLVALVAAWHLGASLPLNEVEDLALLAEDAQIEKAATPAQKAAKKQVNKTKQKVAKALAKVHAKGIKAKGSTTVPVASTTAAASTSTGLGLTGTPPANIVPGSTAVAVPSLPSTDKIATKKAPLKTPKGKKNVNRDIPVGKKGYIHQQAETPIKTANHAIHKISSNLVKEREARYDEARGAVELQQASQAAARAAANLASAIRKTAADKAAKADARVTMLKARIAKAKGKEQAGLQIKLAKATGKQNALMKKAALAGKAVNQAIAKAASVEGRATAQAVADQDGTTRLEHAIVAAASAKMKLAAFDKETDVANKVAANDKRVKKYWNKQQTQIHKKIKVAKDNYEVASAKASAAEHKSAVAAALAFAKKAHLANTVVAHAVDTTPKKPQKLKTKKAATTAPAPAPAPPVSSTAVNAASAAASLKAAQAAANAAVSTAHRTGKASDSKLAEKAIAKMTQLKNAAAAKKRL
jgi:hypothetical protein